MVVLGGRSVGDIVELLADGRDFGLDLTYRYQRGALGIAHAIGLARDFVGDEAFCVVLGDNILIGPPLDDTARAFEQGPFDAGTLLYQVPDPERFGVAEFDAAGRVVGFEEKPAVPKSDLIPIGVYFLRPDAFGVIEGLLPSGRGEFEITDVLNHYVGAGRFFWRRYDGRDPRYRPTDPQPRRLPDGYAGGAQPLRHRRHLGTCRLGGGDDRGVCRDGALCEAGRQEGSGDRRLPARLDRLRLVGSLREVEGRPRD